MTATQGLGLAFVVIFTILFLVFMFSLKDLEDSPKTISFVIGLALALYIAYKVIWG